MLVRTLATHSPEETVALGQALGRRLPPGSVVLLFGQLGSGKTAFAQGLARGLAVPDTYPVTSPTYTLINEYPGQLPFFHVDLYRLPQPADPEEIGLLDLFASNGVVAVEWSERLHPGDRPAKRLEIRFDVAGGTLRSIRIIAYGLDPSDLLQDLVV